MQYKRIHYLRMFSGSESIMLLLVTCACLSLCLCTPTFGNQYVHIKVHVPKEISHQHIHHEPSSYTPIVPPHKVIHHYHHKRRKPPKKHVDQQLHNDNDALLGSIVLSDVKTPISDDYLEFLQHAEDIANHLAKPKIRHLPAKKINTYRVIEETKPAEKVKPHVVDTYKIIETKATPQPKSYIDTIKVIESDYRKPTIEKDPDYGYKPSTHIEYETNADKPHTKTVKIVETNSHSHNYGHTPLTETIEVTETKRHKPTSYYHHQRPVYESNYANRIPSTDYGVPSRPSYSDASYSGHHIGSYKTTSDSYLPPLRDSYEPPQSSYLPPKTSYLPPQDSYLPPQNTYLPPRDSYTSSSNTYLPPRETHFTSPNAYLPTKSPADYGNSYYSASSSSGANDVSNQYLPPALSDSTSDYGHYGHNSAETYTGIDSYTAEHVQGLGSRGYQYA